MARRGTYYLGRVIKGGFTKEDFLKALLNAPIITRINYSWTITKYKTFGSQEDPEFVFGKLVKFELQGNIDIVDPEKHDEIKASIENKLLASSPFVYIPRFSGIAYLHIWNQIQKEVFPRRFSNIIEAYFGNFFVKCEIDPITDYRTFVRRLIDLDYIHKISARITPPNPLFGHLWKPLKEYLEKREADEMKFEETGKENKPLNTKLITILVDLNNNSINLKKEKHEPDIGDSAVLMAADGYGGAKIEGKKGNADIIIRTSENRKSFLFDKEPDPEQLYERAKELFEKINNERHMNH